MFKKKNMLTKLTLSIDEKLIEKAKKYARKNDISVSKMFENYINSLCITEKYKSPTDELIGVLKEAPENYDYKKIYYTNKRKNSGK